MPGPIDHSKQIGGPSLWDSMLAFVENTKLGKWLYVRSGKSQLEDTLNQISQRAGCEAQLAQKSQLFLESIQAVNLSDIYSIKQVKQLNDMLGKKHKGKKGYEAQKILDQVITTYASGSICSSREMLTRIGNVHPSKDMQKTVSALERQLGVIEARSQGLVDAIEKIRMKDAEKSHALVCEQALLNVNLARISQMLATIFENLEHSNKEANEVFEKGFALLLEIYSLNESLSLSRNKEVVKFLFDDTIKRIEGCDPFNSNAMDGLGRHFVETQNQLTQMLLEDQQHQVHVEQIKAQVASISSQLAAFVEDKDISDLAKEPAFSLKKEFDQFADNIRKELGMGDDFKSLEEQLNIYQEEMDTVRLEIRQQALLEKIEILILSGKTSPSVRKLAGDFMGKVKSGNPIGFEDVMNMEKIVVGALSAESDYKSWANQLVGKLDVLLNQSNEGSTQAALMKQKEILLKIVRDNEDISNIRQQLKDVERFILGMEQAILPHRIIPLDKGVGDEDM